MAYPLQLQILFKQEFSIFSTKIQSIIIKIMNKPEKNRTHLPPIAIRSQAISSSYPHPDIKNVYFPYQPYPQQKQLVSQIYHAIQKSQNILVQSPTGSGKTLCMLISSLSTLMNLPTQNKMNKQKIFYLTRTHSQISQVISELKKTSYKCQVNVMASRDSMCINKNLQALKGRNLDRACQQMCGQKLCKYKQDLSVEHRKNRAQKKLFKGLLTIDELKEVGKKQFFCPYYATKQAIEHSNLTILPYNYLLEWNLFEKHHINLRNAVIIFDEAHNIDSLAEEGSSFELTIDSINHAMSEINKLEQQVKCRYLHKRFQYTDQEILMISQMKYFILNLQNQLKNNQKIEVGKQQKIYGNQSDIMHFIKQITEYQSPDTSALISGLNLDNYEEFFDDLKKIQKILSQKKLTSQYFDYFASFFQKLFQVLDSHQSDDYIMIHSYSNNNHSSIKFQCLNPAYAFERIKAHKPRSIILCSGTLSPLQTWQHDLAVTFQTKIKIRSFIHTNQLFTTILSHNKKGQTYDFSYQMKKRINQYQSFAQELGRIEQTVPNGIVVVFSTYQLLQKAIPYCLKLKKKVFYESKTANTQQIYRKYSKECENNGAFLFIIMKGRFAQGINFNDHLCRCLLIVGIPFLPVFDFKVSRKKSYLQAKFGREYSEKWYLNQTFRAVNQAIGRVIRSKNDYGCIILVDQRYRKNENLSQLPEWFRSCLNSQIDQDIIEQMSNFFKERRQQRQIECQIKNQVKYKTHDLTQFEEELNRTIDSGRTMQKSPSLEQLLEQQTPVKPKKVRKLQIIEEQQVRSSKNRSSNKTNRKQISNRKSMNDDLFTEDSVTVEKTPFRNYFPWLSVQNYFLKDMDVSIQGQHQSIDTSKQKNFFLESAQEPQQNENSSQKALEYVKIPKKIHYNAYF